MNYKTVKLTLFLIACIHFSFSYSQELPPINKFSTKDYGAENQNWAISQATNKFIYVANNKGLLEYNGANWQLYPTPNETIMRSVKVLKDKIFTGFYMDFGFWQKDKFGILKYTSIVQNEDIQMLEDEQIWSILETDGWILFKSLERIYLYNLETKYFKIINSESRILKVSKVDDTIYFQENNKGVFKIENGLPKLISDHKVFKENILVEIFAKNNGLLFLTQKKGFFFLNEGKLVKWETPAKNLLDKVTIYSAKQLRNKDFALGTISDGLIYLDSNAAFKYQVTQSSGLSNNTLLSIFEDDESNLWLGLDNGINCINNTSPFKVYNNKIDFLGTIYTSKVFEGNLYVGTNQGLFYRKLDSKENFKFIDKTQGQVWSLSKIDDTLFCGHDSGTFIVNKGVAKKFFTKEGTWQIQKIDENLILQGSYNGLYIIEKKENTWGLRNKIQGFDNSSKYFVILENNKIFVNHEYKGVFKIEIDKDFQKVIHIQKEKSVEKGVHSSLINYQQEILYSNKKGVFLYDKETDTFIKDEIYSQLISDKNFTSAELIYNKTSNKLWSFSKENIKYLTPGKLSNKPIVRVIPISASIPKAASGYENIIHLKNEHYLIGTSDGYISVDLNELNDPKNFQVSINKVRNSFIDSPKRNVDLLKNNTFEFEDNNLEFYYSSPNFNKMVTTKYQYQLVGQSKHWSVASASKSILFENIPFGNYTFKVRAILGDKFSSNEAVFSFVILKPWYLSNTMLSIYVLTFLLLLYLLHVTSKKYYKNQREELLDKAQKELELRELENSQKIIKLNNDKLRNDIESKNRELATSTMNIIKKNEFLNTIKNELITGEDSSVSKVVKIIDKNLNNTDDWKMFQEAFNNADKKFLKKVKSKHPDLTPNDLRLCAYLRLNLSSKEIAPLLNISPRSVEVKRYRLRKKMNLPHDSNLTNYILEI